MVFETKEGRDGQALTHGVAVHLERARGCEGKEQIGEYTERQGETERDRRTCWRVSLTPVEVGPLLAPPFPSRPTSDDVESPWGCLTPCDAVKGLAARRSIGPGSVRLSLHPLPSGTTPRVPFTHVRYLCERGYPSTERRVLYQVLEKLLYGGILKYFSKLCFPVCLFYLQKN